MSLASAFSRLFPRVTPRRFPLRTALFATAFAAAVVPPLQAQNPGDLDTTFLSAIGGTATAGTIYSLFRYDYVDIAGIPRDYLVAGGDGTLFGRLILPTGTVNTADTTPAFGAGDRIVYTIVQDKYMNPDKFFIGGAFGASSTQIPPRQNIFRINSDFTIDAPTITTDNRPVFDPKEGANEYVTAILPTYDGRLVVGGLFTTFNNVTHMYIVRLTDNANASIAVYGTPLTDGTIDPTFDPTLAFDSNVLTLAEQLDPATGQPNGQYLVGGLFNNVNGKPATKLARINNDGSVDTTFKPTIDERVDIVAAQPDGKVLIGGDFTTINGVTETHIARLNFDGSVDTTFSAAATGVLANNTDTYPSVFAISLLTDGRMYVGGNFITMNGVPRQYLARLNANGSLDPAFDPGTNLFASVQFILPDSSSTGDVYVAETGSARINDGSFPPTVVALYQEPGIQTFTNAPAPFRVPEFFAGSAPLGSGYLFLQFPNNNIFGYYDLDFRPYIYHIGLGFEYVFDANDGQNGIYLYDFASGHFFYTSPTYSFPYLYDFTLKSVVYFYPNPNAAGFFLTNPRYFFDFATGQVVSF